MYFGRLRHTVEFQFVIFQKDLQLTDLCAFSCIVNIKLHDISTCSSVTVTEEMIRGKRLSFLLSGQYRGGGGRCFCR
jgi:hypothetical protein